ncbi:MAG: RNA methyltransferase [Prevotella sp.]
MIKLVRSLEMKKNRKKERLFVAEGPKVVGDMLDTYTPHAIIATENWLEAHQIEIQRLDAEQRWTKEACGVVKVTDEELRRTSFLQHPQQVMALFAIPDDDSTDDINPSRQLCLALDGVQDPGNLGTIIRIADWFGIDHIVCSHETADAYNPKVVQATMGSLANVHLHYTDLHGFIADNADSCPIYGTLLDGSDIYSTTLTDNGIIVMGNEGNGITEGIRKKVSHRLLIPDFHKGKSAESLNVAVATAIVCSEFRRRRC